jgi:hypothetical protein
MHCHAAILIAGFVALTPEAGLGDQPAAPSASQSAEFAGPETVPVNALAGAIGAWLTAAFDLPVAPPPEIRFSAPEEMAALYLGAEAAAARGGRSVVALYDRQERTVHLPEGWTGESAAEISMLVHEMVHYLQHEAGYRPGCPAQSEALAYEAQARWLAHFGRDLTGELAIDPLFLKLLAICGL